MRMQFNMVMQGEQSFEEKLEKALKENQNLHMDLIRCFAQAVMMALRLKEEDKITVESFRAGKIADLPPQIITGIEKKVDN